MLQQISPEAFEAALVELGHDPADYRGKRLTIAQMGELYGLDQDIIVDAIDHDMVSVHYDYRKDIIWVDALEAAHFYYCLRTKMSLYKTF